MHDQPPPNMLVLCRADELRLGIDVRQVREVARAVPLSAVPSNAAGVAGMTATSRQWLDLVVYSKNMDLFVKRITRDIKYIANLRKEIDLFNIDLATMVEAVHAKGRKMAA